LQHIHYDLNQVQEKLSMAGWHESEVEKVTHRPDKPIDGDQRQKVRLTRFIYLIGRMTFQHTSEYQQLYSKEWDEQQLISDNLPCNHNRLSGDENKYWIDYRCSPFSKLL